MFPSHLLICSPSHLFPAYSFYLRQSKDDKRITEVRDEEGMGQSGIKFSDTLVFLQHAATGLWLTYRNKEVNID